MEQLPYYPIVPDEVHFCKFHLNTADVMHQRCFSGTERPAETDMQVFRTKGSSRPSEERRITLIKSKETP